MIRRPPRSTLDRSSAASDAYKRQPPSDAPLRCLPRRRVPSRFPARWGSHALRTNALLRNTRVLSSLLMKPAECPWCHAAVKDLREPCPNCGKLALDLRATDPPDE